MIHFFIKVGFIFIFYLIQITVSFSQQKEYDSKTILLYDEAKKNFKTQDYKDAIENLQIIFEKYPLHKEGRLLLSQIYLTGGKTLDPLCEEKAYNQYLFLLKSDSISNADVALNMVKMIISYPALFPESQKDSTFHLKKIKQFLNIFLRHSNPDFSNKLIANYYLSECESILNSLSIPNDFIITNMGKPINSEHAEYFPTISADDSILIFTRRNNINEGIAGDENFFISLKYNNKWDTPSIISELKTEMNEGASSISPDGKTLVFTRCSDKDGYGKCDLYITYKTGEIWSTPENLGNIINSQYWESQPSLSANGNELYFSSDKPGGHGQEDIYVSYKDTNGIWQSPVNLGRNINTSGRDTDPFIHASGKSLYFTSDGWLCLGGFDIFCSERTNDSTWRVPRNMGYPLNTPNHEKGIIVSADGNKGYFYGIQVGGFGNMDILNFTMDKKFKPIPASYVKGVIIDDKKKNIPSATIKIIDLNLPENIIKTQSDSLNGRFLVTLAQGSDYAFYVEKDSYLLKSFYFDYSKPESYKPQNIHLKLEKIEKNKHVVFNNLFFDFNSSEILPKSVIELKEMLRFLNKNPKLKIEIQGHTDFIGTDEYNQILSVKRAKNVQEWLLKNNIGTKRLTCKGFGKKKPLFTNTTEAGRQLNRRTEFRIVGVGD